MILQVPVKVSEWHILIIAAMLLTQGSLDTVLIGVSKFEGESDHVMRANWYDIWGPAVLVVAMWANFGLSGVAGM